GMSSEHVIHDPPDTNTRQPPISEEAQRMLRWLAERCHTSGVHLAYSLPWEYVPESHRRQAVKRNLAFVIQVSEFMPVFKDPRFGVVTNVDYFADTEFHLAPLGVRVRSNEFAIDLREWHVWKTEALRAMA